MALRLVQNFANLKLCRHLNHSTLSEYIPKLPNKPKPVLAEFYAINKNEIRAQVQGLSGKDTLLKVIEIYKKLPLHERENLRKKHYDAFKNYQKELNELIKNVTPEIQTKLIMSGHINNPDKVFNLNVPKTPTSAYSYYTQKQLKHRTGQKNMKGKDLMLEVANQWKGLSKEEKLKYIDEWKSLKEENIRNLEFWKQKMQNMGYPSELIEILSSQRGIRAFVRSRRSLSSSAGSRNRAQDNTKKDGIDGRKKTGHPGRPRKSDKDGTTHRKIDAEGKELLEELGVDETFLEEDDEIVIGEDGRKSKKSTTRTRASSQTPLSSLDSHGGKNQHEKRDSDRHGKHDGVHHDSSRHGKHDGGPDNRRHEYDDHNIDKDYRDKHRSSTPTRKNQAGHKKESDHDYPAGNPSETDRPPQTTGQHGSTTHHSTNTTPHH